MEGSRRVGAQARSLVLHRSTVGRRTGGPAILAIHGITGSRRYWLPRISPLAAKYRLLVPDLPGFGFSPKPFVDYTPEFHVESLVGLLDQSGLESTPVHVVGHSLGAVLGLELAARYPERVSRMVLMNLPRFQDPEKAHRAWLAGSAAYRNLLTVNSLAANMAQVRRTGLRLTARYLRRLPWGVVADARRFTFRSLTSTLENCLLHYSVDPTLDRQPSIPILLVHGDRDQVAPLEAIRELPKRHPFLSLEVIAGAGHHPFHTHTSSCLKLIDAHLGARSSSRTGARASLLADTSGP